MLVMPHVAVKSKTIVLMALALGLACVPARGQDSFVPTGLKSTCEWTYGTECARVGRPRTRIVRVPVVKYRAYRHVPEHLAPLRREPEVKGWRHDRDRRRHFDAGPRCWPVMFKAYSDEKISRDAALEAQRRWSGEVRAELGERYMDFAKATTKREECWQSSTEERALDKATGSVKRAWRRVKDAVTGEERDEEIPTGSHERCMVEARPCRAERNRERDDE